MLHGDLRCTSRNHHLNDLQNNLLIFFSQVQVNEQVREYLKKPTFDNWQWDDPEMLVLMRQMFIDLNITAKFNIEVNVMYFAFLYPIVELP